MQCGADVRATYRKQRILLYNNDLPINCSKKLSFRIFADDTNMFYTSDKLQHLETVMNEELKLVFTYILIKIYTGDHRFNTTHGQQARYYVDLHTLRQLYFSFIYPYLTHDITLAGVVLVRPGYITLKRNRINVFAARSLLIAGTMLCPTSIF